MLDETGALIGSGDSQPFGGDYPTSWWLAGETLVEDRVASLSSQSAPDKVALAIGLYRLADLARLPIVDSAGRPQADNQIILSDQLHSQPY